MSKHTPGPWVIDWNATRLDICNSEANASLSGGRRPSA